MLISDLIKDLKSLKNPGQIGAPIVWISGLAKSGTTLVENVVSNCGYVDANRSLLRRFYYRGEDVIGRIPTDLFDKLPRSKGSFHKTHTFYEDYIKDILTDNSIRVVVPVRNIRDALVSRMFHILSDEKHWQHSLLIKEIDKPEKMFMESITTSHPEKEISQGEYFAQWVDSWSNSIYKDRMIWYESYLSDPQEYIKRVAELIDCKASDPVGIGQSINRNTRVMKRLTKNLWIRRMLFRGSSGTFRSGKSGSYLEYKSIESEEFFKDLEHRYIIKPC